MRKPKPAPKRADYDSPWKEALEKYLQLEPNGQFADAAKGMLQTIGATIQTNYSNPSQKKGAPAKK